MLIRKIMLFAFVIGLLVWIASPHEISSASGCGDTPIKLLSCMKTEKDEDCMLMARFVTFKRCEYFKQFSDAICDSTSDPGKILCTIPKSAVEGRCRE